MREVEDAITSLERNKRMLEMQTDTYKQEGCNELVLSFLEAECAAYDLALSALREQICQAEKAERENPKPLTLDEMKSLNCEPIWTVTIGVEGSGRADVYRHAEECDAVYIEVYLSDVGELLTALEAQQREIEGLKSELDAVVKDLTKLCKKPINPCHSCAKTCIFPEAANGTINYCSDWRWRGTKGAE